MNSIIRSILEKDHLNNDQDPLELEPSNYFERLMHKRMTQNSSNTRLISKPSNQILNPNRSQPLIKSSTVKLSMNSMSHLINENSLNVSNSNINNSRLVHKRLSKILYQTKSILGVPNKPKLRQSLSTRQKFMVDINKLQHTSSSFTSDSIKPNKPIKPKNAKSIGSNISTSDNFMGRPRIFRITEQQAIQHSKKLYFISDHVLNTQCKIRDTSLQVKAITDQLKLIAAYLQQFKVGYISMSIFLKSFMAQSNDHKAKYNILLEQTAALILQIQPLILKQIYGSLHQIIYCVIPEIYEERKRLVITEDECFRLNMRWFIEVMTYFTACYEVYEIIKAKAIFLTFTQKEYYTLKTFLDFLRYNCGALITSSKMHIDKYNHDEKMLRVFEEDVELRERKSARVASYRSNRTKLPKSMNRIVADKLAQINIALGYEKKKMYKQVCKNHLNEISLINLPVVNKLMKYYDKSTKEQIIAQRVVNRYREKERLEKSMLDLMNKQL